MLKTLRNRVQSEIDNGKTLKQVVSDLSITANYICLQTKSLALASQWLEYGIKKKQIPHPFGWFFKYESFFALKFYYK